MLRFMSLLAALLIAAVAPAQAAPAGQPQRLAVLIGNWDYDLDSRFTDPSKPGYVSDLRNPCRDVALVKTSLAVAGFTIYDHCNMTQPAFAREIQDLSAKLQDLPKGSVVFVYYSGHGMQTGGRNFLIPVMFNWDAAGVNALTDEKQLAFFRANANEVGALFRKLPDDPDIAVIVALDNCRDNPVDAKSTYNEAVSIRTPANALVLYATTAGDTTSDNSAAQSSDFAAELVGQLDKGKDLSDVFAQVNIALYERFRAGKRDTYAELDAGAAFSAMRSVPVRIKVQPPATSTTSSDTAPTKKLLIRNVYDGKSLDILWCQGPGEVDRYRFARDLAEKVKLRARELQVGRIQLKPLSESLNANGGYNVHRNLMRYDYSLPDERIVLMNIAQAFPEGNFLLRRGVGVDGNPTPNYVSAFICGDVATP